MCEIAFACVCVFLFALCVAASFAVLKSMQQCSIWVKYAEMELRHKNVQHARNVYERATKLLPRESQLWYKHVFMEELLENPEGARQVFQRWMQWRPPGLLYFLFLKK